MYEFESILIHKIIKPKQVIILLTV